MKQGDKFSIVLEFKVNAVDHDSDYPYQFVCTNAKDVVFADEIRNILYHTFDRDDWTNGYGMTSKEIGEAFKGYPFAAKFAREALEEEIEGLQDELNRLVSERDSLTDEIKPIRQRIASLKKQGEEL